METRNNQTVAFTGHRKERILQGSGNDSRILAQIREAVTGVVTELYGQGYKEYYTGMASGFDMTAAEAVLQVMGFAPLSVCAPAARGSPRPRRARLSRNHRCTTGRRRFRGGS